MKGIFCFYAFKVFKCWNMTAYYRSREHKGVTCEGNIMLSCKGKFLNVGK